MKIRTDFVTNSSSSSFTVSIVIKTVDGKTYHAKVEPDDGGGNGNADIRCSAETLLNCPSVASLMDAIYDAVTVTISPFDDSGQSKEYFAQGVRNLAARVKKKVQSLDQIATLTFRRKWYAWGEYSSCFGTNIDVYAPELSALARRLREAEEDNADEEELEALKEEMRFYIRYHERTIDGAQGGCFPTGFMGGSPRCYLNMYGGDDDPLGFAHAIGGSGYNDDEGVETTVIDMQKKTIRHGAVYGECSWDGIWDDDSAYEYLWKFVCSRNRKRYAEIRQQVLSFIKSLPLYSGPVEYWQKTFIGNDLPAGIGKLGGYRKSLREYVASAGRYQKYPSSSDYWIIDIDNMLPEADAVPDDAIKDDLHYLENLMIALKAASDSNARFIDKAIFFEAVEWERQNNYPSAEVVLDSRKSGIPFDHVSTLDCKGKIIATANLVYDYHERIWLYEYLCIDGKDLSWDAYPTRNWLIEKDAVIQSDVTRKCDYLIVGMNATIDTPKVAKAIRYRDSGKANIKIIPEDELLRILNGEVLEIPEEYRRAQQAREEAARKAEEMKQQVALAKQRQDDEARQRDAERRREMKAAQEQAIADMRQQRREARQAEFLQRQEAEQAAKEAKKRQAAEEREQQIANEVLYRPGEEPEILLDRMTVLFEKLNAAYPDKQISGLQAQHKKLSEKANEIRKQLGYPDSHAFLEAYGYTFVNALGGRPSTVDPEAIIEELKRRYPNGGYKTVAKLMAANSDLPLKTLRNNAQKLFGMSLGDYLKEIGVLS